MNVNEKQKYDVSRTKVTDGRHNGAAQDNSPMTAELGGGVVNTELNPSKSVTF